MKRIIVLLFPVLLFLTASGQTNKGQIYVSGGAGIQFLNYNVKFISDGEISDKTSSSTFTILPSFAYFVQDNMAVGLASNITFTKDDPYNSTSLMLVPVGLYFFSIDEKIKPFVQLGVGFASLTSKYESGYGNTSKGTASGLAFNGGGGIAYFLNERISLNFGLSYTSSTMKEGDSDEKTKQGNFASNIGIGVYF